MLLLIEPHSIWLMGKTGAGHLHEKSHTVEKKTSQVCRQIFIFRVKDVCTLKKKTCGLKMRCSLVNPFKNHLQCLLLSDVKH